MRSLKMLWQNGCSDCQERFGKEEEGKCFWRHFRSKKMEVLVRIRENISPHQMQRLQLTENTYMPLPLHEEAEGYQRYYNLLKVREEFPDLLEHGKVYLDLLAKRNQKEKLNEVYSECVSHDEKFSPKPTTLIKVAGSLNESGRPKESIKAYNRFIKADPKNPLVPKAYFLVSNIFNEKLNDPGKAVRVLKGGIKKYPNHDIIPHAERYLSQIKVS